MEEQPKLPASQTGHSGLKMSAAKWQQKIDSATSVEASHIIKAAIVSLDAQLDAGEVPIRDNLVYCKGEGYVENLSDSDLLVVQADSQLETYLGISEGANVVPVMTLETRATRLLLVHTVSLHEINSVAVNGEHPVRRVLHMPVDRDNFMPLRLVSDVFDSLAPNVDRPKENIDFINRQFSADIARGRFASFSPANLQRRVEETIARIESIIGPKGCSLLMQSDVSYVMEIKSNSRLQMSEQNALSLGPKWVTFMGVGDFRSFSRSALPTNLHNFDYGRHNGLFIAAALSDLATIANGLHRQVLMIPLSDNSYRFESH